MKLKHISKTDKGLVRPVNEDNLDVLINNSGEYSNIYIVCDGMGGHVGGAKASQIAVSSIKEYFSHTPSNNPNTALKEAIEMANMQILGEATVNPEFKGMGTTVTVLVECDGVIYIAHVGDSRIYIINDNKLNRLTKDHSYVQSLVDAGELLDSEMESHPRKNELTRALGISQDVDVEVVAKPILAKQGDKFLLCTDGLCGLIDDNKIQNIINNSDNLEDASNKLIYAAKNQGGHDNITVILLEVEDSDHTKTQCQYKNPIHNVTVTNPNLSQTTASYDEILPKKSLRSSQRINKKIKIISALVLILIVGLTSYLFLEKGTDEVSDDLVVDDQKNVKSEQKLIDLVRSIDDTDQVGENNQTEI